MLKIIGTSLLSFLLLSCTDKAQSDEKQLLERKSDSIQLNVIYPDSQYFKSVNLLYIDEKNDKIMFEANQGNADSKSFYIVATTPVFMLDWTDNQHYYVLYPNEKITITPVNNTEESLYLTSSDSNREEELAFFERLSDEELRILESKSKVITKMPLQQMTKHDLFLHNLKARREKDTKKAWKHFREKYNNRKAFLKRYETKYKLSASFKAIAYNFFKYDYLANVFFNLNNSKTIKSRNIDSLEKELGFTKNDFNCQNCLYIPSQCH